MIALPFRFGTRGVYQGILIVACFCRLVSFGDSGLAADSRPHVVLVMADDMGWGQTGYRDHPILETPNLDDMAEHGLRFERFYAGAPNCSPTRATVLTGRTNDRTGVNNHGYALRHAEKTLPEAMRRAGYATAHFGKWHLNGMRGPGAPIFRDDDHGPGTFGFDEWISVTNFFDRDPLMSRNGAFESFSGDSSEIVVAQAIDFLDEHTKFQAPMFLVLWFGSPHSPWDAEAADMQFTSAIDDKSKRHYGELVAMDRAIGRLRDRLRDSDLRQNTLLWFCSDNGGLPGIKPSTVGPLRGFKNSVYEGGLRVPAIIEWPAVISEPRVTKYPACTMDIFPTLVDALDLSRDSMMASIDGTSLVPLFANELQDRETPIGFRHTGRAAWIDNDFKLVTQDIQSQEFQLFDLAADPRERSDLSTQMPDRFERMKKQFQKWNRSVQSSSEGSDYPEGSFDPDENQPRVWNEVPAYAPYLKQWKNRPEYRSWLSR